MFDLLTKTAAVLGALSTWRAPWWTWWAGGDSSVWIHLTDCGHQFAPWYTGQEAQLVWICVTAWRETRAQTYRRVQYFIWPDHLHFQLLLTESKQISMATWDIEKHEPWYKKEKNRRNTVLVHSFSFILTLITLLSLQQAQRNWDWFWPQVLFERKSAPSATVHIWLFCVFNSHLASCLMTLSARLELGTFGTRLNIWGVKTQWKPGWTHKQFGRLLYNKCSCQVTLQDSSLIHLSI